MKTAYCWDGRNFLACQRIDVVAPLALGAFSLAVPIALLWRYIARAAAATAFERAEAERMRVIHGRLGELGSVDMFSDPRAAERLFMAQAQLYAATKIATAPFERLPDGLDTYSEAAQEAPQAPALAAPATEATAPHVGPLPPSEWLPQAEAAPHKLLAAETGGGKTTLAKILLGRAMDGGAELFVIDPHGSAWLGLPTVGGGENWRQIDAALLAVVREYGLRLAERDQIRRTTGREPALSHWPRLVVLLDEANNVKMHYDRTRKRGGVTTWEQFVLVLGSGARKVNISVIGLVHSCNVEDLGISGAMRSNYCVIALDHRVASQQIDQNEPDRTRRQALHRLIAGREWPATFERNGQVWALDRAGMDRAELRTPPDLALWNGWDYAAGAPSVRLQGPPTAAEGHTPDQTDGQTVKAELVRAYKAAGHNRDQIRAKLHALGMGLDNAEYTRITGSDAPA